MNWIVYFTNYGNCKKVADLIKRAHEGAKIEVKIESGEVKTPEEVIHDDPSTIFFGCPIRKKHLSKQGKRWLKALAGQLRARRERAGARQGVRDPDPAVVPKKITVGIFYTHRFPEDEFRIDINIKKYLHGLDVHDELGKNAAAKRAKTFLDAVCLPLLGVTVGKITGPLEDTAAEKVESWFVSFREK